MNPQLYTDREQTFVKHFFLTKYLQRFAHIIGRTWPSITYVDCFSGPWQNKDEELSDTSPAIAISMLKEAKATLSSVNPGLKLRCFFIEEKPNAFALLDQFVGKQEGGVEFGLSNSTFQDAIPEIIRFANAGGQRNFVFYFIDPTGWTGIDPETLQPLLLTNRSCEVLVNYMTSHIRRHLNNPQCDQQQIAVLFDNPQDQERANTLTGDERDYAIVQSYCRKLKRIGKFMFVAPMIVANPLQDRSHFHLIYGTRDVRGIEVFKDAEKTTFPAMDDARIAASHREKAQKEDGQGFFSFSAEAMHESTYLQDLRRNFNKLAHQHLIEYLRAHPQCDYKFTLFPEIMQFPLTWKKDLEDWIWKLEGEGRVEIVGLAPRERALLRDTDVTIKTTTSF